MQLCAIIGWWVPKHLPATCLKTHPHTRNVQKYTGLLNILTQHPHCAVVTVKQGQGHCGIMSAFLLPYKSTSFPLTSFLLYCRKHGYTVDWEMLTGYCKCSSRLLCVGGTLSRILLVGFTIKLLSARPVLWSTPSADIQYSNSPTHLSSRLYMT